MCHSNQTTFNFTIKIRIGQTAGDIEGIVSMVTGVCVQPTVFAFNHHGLTPRGIVALLKTVRPGQGAIVEHRRAGRGRITRGDNVPLERGLIENKTPSCKQGYV